jgi:hypothetical protein
VKITLRVEYILVDDVRVLETETYPVRKFVNFIIMQCLPAHTK